MTSTLYFSGKPYGDDNNDIYSNDDYEDDDGGAGGAGGPDGGTHENVIHTIPRYELLGLF